MDYQQSLTPFYALQLCSFPWLTAALFHFSKSIFSRKKLVLFCGIFVTNLKATLISAVFQFQNTVNPRHRTKTFLIRPKTFFITLWDGEFHPCPNSISSATKSEPSGNSASHSSGNGYKATQVNAVLCLIKVDSNTIELTVNPSCYCVLDLLFVLYFSQYCTFFRYILMKNLCKGWVRNQHITAFLMCGCSPSYVYKLLWK